MRFLIVALGLMFATAAKADILFFDTNFSPTEIVAVRAAAKARGEAAHIFPERTEEQQKNLDKYYRLTHSLYAKMRTCKGEACEKVRQQLSEAQKNQEKWASQLRRIDPTEFSRIFAELNQRGVEITSLVLSGHSGGTGSVGGLLGAIELEMVKAAFAANPGMIDSVKTVLLWGCYSGTLHSLNNLWRAAFPSVSIWGGFENQSPLGIRESSGRFLKSFLLSEEKLRAARGLRETHRVFRALDLVAELDGTAVVHDAYFTYDEASTLEEMLRRCQSFDSKKLETFECYENGLPGCENPPADHRGEMRDLYGFLQKNRHCRMALLEKYPGLPSLEYLIRLIYLDNVKKNFKAHHGGESENFDRLHEKVGARPARSLLEYANTTRAEDVRAFAEDKEQYKKLGWRDLAYLDHPSWREHSLLIYAQDALPRILGPSRYRSADFSCVPFSWVDPGSTEKDNCYFSEIVNPEFDLNREERLATNFSWARVRRFALERGIAEIGGQIPRNEEIFQTGLLNYLEYTLAALRKLEDRSAVEDRWVSITEEKLNRVKGMEPKLAAWEEAQALKQQLAFMDTQIARMLEYKYGRDAVESLRGFGGFIRTYIEKLEGFSKP